MLGFLVTLITNPTVLTGLGLAGAWLWHKVKGDKQQSLKDLASGFARQAVTELVGQPDAASKAADYIEQKIIDGAEKLGISAAMLAAAKPLIDPIVQHAVADVLAQIQQRADAQANANAAIAKLAERIGTFNADFAAAALKGHAAGKAIADEFAETTVLDAVAAPAGATP